MVAQTDLPFDQFRLVHRQGAGGVLQSHIHVSHRRLGGNRGLAETLYRDAEGVRSVPGIVGAGVTTLAAAE